MESPNSEYRGRGGEAGGFEATNKMEQLSDQYKSMRELLKVYGLSVTEEMGNPQKEMNILEATAAHKATAAAATALLLPPTAHPSELLRTAFAEQLLNGGGASPWLDLCRSSSSTASNGTHFDSDNNSPPLPLSTPHLLMGSAKEESSSPLLPQQTLRRFESAAECGQIDCILQQLRDHYHCEDRYCLLSDEQQQPGRRYSKTFSKKEELVRHCKWHKKRAETLKFGFLRFSCLDDCQQNEADAVCQFNGKQTHYHCIETDCDKVYISTSDVQMHANYHRKTNAIRMQGFLRVRNLETCQEPACPYANQQTTHFHCLRDGCQFTFKNKGEMEKHKVYHLKDEQLLSDGFKKFFKADQCRYANCRYDGKLNHIHCIRPNCSYVFHSSGQLMSHKRKHEKSDHQLTVLQSNNTASTLSDCDTDSSLLDLSVVGVSGGRTGGQQSVNGSLISRKSPIPVLAAVASGTLPPQGHNPQLLLPAAVNPQLPSIMTSSNDNNKVLQITSIDGLFNRKRGRPPKNRFVEVYNSNHARTSYPPQNQMHGRAAGAALSADSPQAIFASFKLDKSVTGGGGGVGMSPKETPSSMPEGSSRGSMRKKPKLMEPKEMRDGGEPSRPVVGLIKSTGIFFPNAAPLPSIATKSGDNLCVEEYHSNSSTDSEGNRRQGRLANNTIEGGRRSQDREVEEEEAHSTDEDEERNDGSGNSSAGMNRFAGEERHQSESRISHLPANPFVPPMFPMNLLAMERNNRESETNGMVSGMGMGMGMEWLKYAYQQPNPLMVFATTAALLAASMNSSSQPQQAPLATMDPNILEYAKNMFLYNNFQQQQQQQPPQGLTEVVNVPSFRLAANGHGSGHHESHDPSSLYAGTRGDTEGGGEMPRNVSAYAKDEAIPAGYLKFRFNEDCQFATCGYRNHQSHFHCLRDNCFYSFCDKTRFVQHTARHERLDKLMGSDFKQYRSNMNCGYDGCEHGMQSQQQQHQHQSRLTEEDEGNASSSGGGGKLRNPSSKSSHFHCQKCDYICTDTNKVVAHRRQHNKTDFIRLSGFRKVASAEPCIIEGEGAGGSSPQEINTSPEATAAAAEGVGSQMCHYSGKQTHYHCLVCNGVVLNRSQLAVHRHKGQPK